VADDDRDGRLRWRIVGFFSDGGDGGSRGQQRRQMTVVVDNGGGDFFPSPVSAAAADGSSGSRQRMQATATGHSSRQRFDFSSTATAAAAAAAAVADWDDDILSERGGSNVNKNIIHPLSYLNLGEASEYLGSLLGKNFSVVTGLVVIIYDLQLRILLMEK